VIPAAEVEDRSKYIRTMAKDVAAITGSGRVTPAAMAPSAPKKEMTVDGVGLPVVEEPFFDRRQAQEAAPETVALPSVNEASEILAPKMGATAPITPATPTKSEDRDAILARLRKKVGESAQMSIQSSPAPYEPPTPAPQGNEWPDIPVPPPVFAPAPEAARPVERMPQVGRETPAPAAAAGLHTYTSDFADRIDTKSASAFSVLAAEQDARGNPPRQVFVQKKDHSRVLLALGSGVLLLLLAAGGIIATYQLVMHKKVTPVAPLSVPSIVFADEYKELKGTGPELLAALADTANETLVSGNVLVTYVTEPIADAKGIPIAKPAPGSVLITALDLPAPDILLRNIGTDSTVGIINSGDQTRPFFVLRVDSYERTYAGMLTWEPLMERDLAALYPLYPAPAVPAPAAAPVASTTQTNASSTPPAPSEPIQAQALTRFADAIVANHDVRVLRDTSGKSLILYGYADKRTLIIARDESAFEALLARLQNGD
jgi:hypothetical protein